MVVEGRNSGIMCAVGACAFGAECWNNAMMRDDVSNLGFLAALYHKINLIHIVVRFSHPEMFVRLLCA